MNDTVAHLRNDRALFLWLLLTSLVGALSGVPWAVVVSSDPAFAWLEAGSSLLQLLPACAVGVWLGPKVGLGSGLRELASRTPRAWETVRKGILPGTLVGLAIGAVVSLGVSSLPENARIPGWENPTILEGFLRCLSAALTEEIVFRFGLMTLLAWVVWLGLKRPGTHAIPLWVGNLLAALLFAAAHLPGQPPDMWNPVMLVPMLTVNAASGMIMGWLFMRYGFISAISAHFVADVVQLVIPRLVALGG
jgi:hypothetical protein